MYVLSWFVYEWTATTNLDDVVLLYKASANQLQKTWYVKVWLLNQLWAISWGAAAEVEVLFMP